MIQMANTYTCEAHGEYPSEFAGGMQWDCPACKIATRSAEEKWRAAWRIRLRWENAGIPERYRGRTLDNWIPTSKAQATILAAVRAYVAAAADVFDTGRGIILLGSIGTGKTHLAVGVLHKVIALGYSGRFVRAGDLFAAIKRSFGKGADEFDDSPLRKAAFLVLDDLGASRGTEWEIAILHDLLAHRYDETLPTIITTNEPDFDRVEGQRNVDRFDENALRLTLSGLSQRKAAGAAKRMDAPDVIPEPAKTIEVVECRMGRMSTREIAFEGRPEPQATNSTSTRERSVTPGRRPRGVRQIRHVSSIGFGALFSSSARQSSTMLLSCCRAHSKVSDESQPSRVS